MFVVSKIFDILVPPFERQFSLKDVSISYPHEDKETVNNTWLWLCSLLFPAFIIILLNFPKFKIREIHRALLGLFFSTALAYLITHTTKNLVGRLRPDFLDRCNPSSDKPLR
ncbi:Diacylglycerol pyrophosphate phosphatase 1 [Entomophthora muscae]|uniref:Diacylglycerol pyrophosphate phosphatase 1 n=1 Tax=Entomophthora muscae TaxID=34485 RepID=A0ACC2UUL9_9FUNG|nr:Diacylglycerol pyrophosphate phosphatase 1 [Entomophthora muscae]